MSSKAYAEVVAVKAEEANCYQYCCRVWFREEKKRAKRAGGGA